MNFNFLKILILVLLVTCSANSVEQANSLFLENVGRIGYDDNFSNGRTGSDYEGTLYFSDTFTINGQLKPSERTVFLYFWQPEMRYRVNATDELLYLQDFFGNYTYLINKSTQLQLTDRAMIHEPDIDQLNGKYYAQNDFKASLKRKLGEVTDLGITGGYVLRRNAADPQNFETRDFDRYLLSSFASRALSDNKSLSAGMSYTAHKIKFNAGGMSVLNAFCGYDHSFSSKIKASGQLGISSGTVENMFNDESTSKEEFYKLGFNYEISDRTRINSSISHSMQYTTLTAFNAENRSDFLLAFQHDFTPGLNFSLSYSFIKSEYISSFDRDENATGNVEDLNKVINARLSYQINELTGYEIGVQSRNRDGYDGSDTERNKLFLGWRYNI